MVVAGMVFVLGLWLAYELWVEEFNAQSGW